MSPSFVERCREICLTEGGIFVERRGHERHPSAYSSFTVNPSVGTGWMDVLEIGHGIAIGRGVFESSIASSHMDAPGFLGVFILLTGRLHLRGSDAGRKEIYEGGAVGLRNRRYPEEVTLLYEQPTGHRLQCVSVDLPVSFLEELRDEAPSPGLGSILNTRAGNVRLSPNHPAHSYGLKVARALMEMSGDTTIGRLRMESVSLDLIATLVGSKAFEVTADGGGTRIPNRQRVAVNEAVDILREEYAEHHTIGSLARRVGINECYLKSAFRVLTGHTIADYLRGVRMEKARVMIESHGVGVTEAATFVGYSNPSHFAAGFKKVHGVLPSSLKDLCR